MIVVMKLTATEENIKNVMDKIGAAGLSTNKIVGSDQTVIGVVGNTGSIDRDTLSMFEGVERILKVQEPFKKANIAFKPARTVVDVCGVKIGADEPVIIAGPCSVESREQIVAVAQEVKKSGAGMLRGGAFKPRTSPYAFQGLEADGLKLLMEARKETGLPIVSEITAPRMMEQFEASVDMLQIGARNMQNFDLLKEVGRSKKPVLLKRGLSSTIEEWLMSAEYILAGGNENVVLCERGIRTFETYTRNTLDISAIAAVKKLSHLPIIIDPSHATGKSWMCLPLCLAGLAAGADGIIIEVHNDPVNALCDGAQSITPDSFDDIMKTINSTMGTLAPIRKRFNEIK